jgi:glucoamylase
VSAAATDRVDEAAGWLSWLDRHRTEAGSLPEKVLYNGSPAAVAPLAWTSALVLIALTQTPPGADTC